MYRGTGVSHGVLRTTWDRSLENWELQIPSFEEFFWGGNTLGLVPASLPHALGYACTFYAPTSPPPKERSMQLNRTLRAEFTRLIFGERLHKIEPQIDCLGGLNFLMRERTVPRHFCRRLASRFADCPDLNRNPLAANSTLTLQSLLLSIS